MGRTRSSVSPRARRPHDFQNRRARRRLPFRGPISEGYFDGHAPFIVALWSAAWWTAHPRAKGSVGPTINLVVTSMLLVNHVIASLLSVERQNRVRLVQFIFIGAFALFVFRTASTVDDVADLIGLPDPGQLYSPAGVSSRG